jgi:NDP-4-keto-2,6-dideoxyhexose 3-C-methyltransferase
MIYTETTSCRACSHALPAENVFSLGDMAVVDFPISPDEHPIIAPLDLVECPNCTLVQLRHTVDPEILFRHFWYRSGVTQSMRESLRDIAQSADERVRLERDDGVLDVGTNDGTLLEFYPNYCFKAGFEPAVNVADAALKKGFTIITDFFTENKIPTEWHRRFKVVTAIAMFYDLESPGDFLESVKTVLHPEGVFIAQMNYLGFMLKLLSVDNICHEHLTYYTVRSFTNLCLKHSLHVEDVEFNPVNGGSARFYVSNGSGTSQEVEKTIAGERQNWADFSSRLSISKNLLKSYLSHVPQAAICGASTRGLSILQWLGMGRERFLAAGDRDPLKHGRYYGATGIPIVSEQEARERAKFFLVLPRHFEKEIVAREDKFIQSGGELLFPIPAPKVISARGEHYL